MLKTKKTVYDPPDKSDGKRILVMKIWPRGVSKDSIDEWIKELGTDKELIKKWKAEDITWTEFKKEYLKSLKGKEDLLKKVAGEARKKTITLLCSCKEENRCHRSLLKAAIEKLI